MGRIMHRFRHSGLLVESARALPEWSAFAVKDDGACDVRIVMADPQSIETGDGNAAMEGGALRFAIEGIGAWEMAGGRTIRVVPDARAGPAELRLFTLGSAWSAIGLQRGHAVWHGSAVTRNGRTLMICGPQGAGKSTLAAAMLAKGWRLVADDLARIEVPRGHVARIYPSATRLKLWSDAVERLGWQDRILHRDYFRADKFHCEAGGAGIEPLPLSAIVVLEEAATLSTERLTGHAAVTGAFSAALYRPDQLDALKAWPVQTALAATICAATPVYRLTRPRTPEGLAESCARLNEL